MIVYDVQILWKPTGVANGAENLPSSSRSELSTTIFVVGFFLSGSTQTVSKTPSSSSVDPGLCVEVMN